MRVLAILLIAGSLMAQDKPKAEPSTAVSNLSPDISTEDKLQLRNYQLTQAQALQALQSTPQWQLFINAQQQSANFFNSLYPKYKVDQSKQILCDGPQLGGPCGSLKAGEIQFKPIEGKK